MTKIEEIFEKLIKATEHPLAPHVIEHTLQAIHNLGTLMVGPARKEGLSIERMDELREKFLAGLTDKDALDFYKPEFIIMLCGALTASIKGYVRKVGKQ